MKVILSILLLMSSAAFVAAQESSQSTRPVVNDDIVQMSRVGVLPAVIIAKIRTTACKFDTSPSALVALKEVGVADEVLMEMVRNPSGAPPPAPERATKPTPQQLVTSSPEPKATFDNELPEYGDISELRRMRRVFVIADDIDSQNLLINSLRSYDGLDVVGSPDRAEIFIAFGQGSSATGMELRGLFAGTLDYRTKAQFIVFYRSETGRKRIVWRETEDIQTTSGFTLSRPNEVNVIRHFVNALKKIRGQ